MLYLFQLTQTWEEDDRKGRKKKKVKERLVIKVEQYLSEKTRSKTAGEEEVQGQRKKRVGCFIYLFLMSCLPYS